MEARVFEKLSHFSSEVFRNTVGIGVNPNPFDDLSNDPDDWEEAGLATDFSNRFSLSVLHYHAIDYVFSQRSWAKSRFGDGSFPIWYGSIELSSTFHETIFHWRQFLLNSHDMLAATQDQPIYHARTVFKVTCQSVLVDLRNKETLYPFLVSPDDYQQTQELGIMLSKDGMPGIITRSVRCDNGTNVAVFNRRSLSSPSHHGDFLYKLDPYDLKKVQILNHETNQKVGQVENYAL